MIKRFLSVVLLIALLVLIVGCKEQNETQQTQSESVPLDVNVDDIENVYNNEFTDTQDNETEYTGTDILGGTFTNKYGTATTKCAHTGCNNYIASSGDTNCCVTHSNSCLDCNKYIDEDAYWCVSCIAKAATPTCEACSKDAVYTITGITGQTEYYCTEHYNEMQELLDWLENN